MKRIKFKALLLLVGVSSSLENSQEEGRKDLSQIELKKKKKHNAEKKIQEFREKFQESKASLSKLYHSASIQFLLRNIVFHDAWTMLYTALIMCEPILSILAIQGTEEMLKHALNAKFPMTEVSRKGLESFYSALFYKFNLVGRFWTTEDRAKKVSIANHDEFQSFIGSAIRTQSVHYLDNLLYKLLVNCFPLPWPGSSKDLIKPVNKLFLMPQSFYEQYKPEEIANAVLYRYVDAMPLLYTPIRMVQNFVMMLRFAIGIWYICEQIHYPAVILLAQYFWSDINRTFKEIEDHNAYLKTLEKGGSIRPFNAIIGTMQNMSLINMSGTWPEERKNLKKKIRFAPPMEVSDPRALIMQRIFLSTFFVVGWYSIYHRLSGKIFGLHSIPSLCPQLSLFFSIFGLSCMTPYFRSLYTELYDEFSESQFAKWIVKNIKRYTVPRFIFEATTQLIDTTANSASMVLRNINPYLAIILTLASFRCSPGQECKTLFAAPNEQQLSSFIKSVRANYNIIAIVAHLYQICSLLTQTWQDEVLVKEKFRVSELNAQILSYKPRRDASLPQFKPSGPSCPIRIEIPEGFQYQMPESREES